MTRLELYILMNEIVRLVNPGINTMIADDNHGSPDGLYCSIKPFQGTVQRGQANQTITTDSVTIKPQLISEVSFNFYRDGANRAASNLFQANKRPDVQLLLRGSSVGWNRSTPIRDLTGKLSDTTMEERAQISVFITHEDSHTVEFNTITTVSYEVEDSKGDTLDTGVIN